MRGEWYQNKKVENIHLQDNVHISVPHSDASDARENAYILKQQSTENQR